MTWTLYKEPPKTTSAAIGRLSVARVGAEFASGVAGVLAVDAVSVAAPSVFQAINHKVADYIVRPSLGMFDHLANALSAAEGEENIERRKSMNVQEKTDYYAHAVTKFGLDTAAGVVGQFGAQYFLNHAFKMPEIKGETGKLAAIAVGERALQIGAVYALNNLCPSQTSAVQGSVARTLGKMFNLDENYAMEKARYLVHVQAPNMLGMGASILGMAHIYKENPGSIGLAHHSV